MYFTYIFPRKYKILLLVSVVLLCWILFVKFSSMYVISKSYDDEKEIIQTRNGERVDYCTKKTDKLKENISVLSSKITGNLEVRKDVEKGDVKRLFEAMKDFDISGTTSLEIFDKRLESVYFSGKQVAPEIIPMQKSMNGIQSSTLKEIGFFTYFITYVPVKSLTNDVLTEGVLVISELIDSKYSTVQVDLPDKVLSAELSKEIGKNVKFVPYISGAVVTPADSENAGSIDFLSSDKKVIGKIIYPKYDLEEHIESINELSWKSIALLSFLFTISIIPVFLRFINLFKPVLIRFVLFLILLALVRYFWILIGFPSEITGGDIFEAHYFAVKFGAGIFKSLGDLLVTVLFIVLYALYVSYISFDFIIKSKTENNGGRGYYLLKLGVLVLVFFGLFYFYGISIKSLIYDSNIRFLEKVNIIPDTPLFIIQLVILLITFSFLLFEVTLVYSILHYSRLFYKVAFIRKYHIIFSFILFLLFNEIINIAGINISLINLHRFVIITMLFIFAYYLSNVLAQRRNLKFFSFRNISILFLFSIIITPIIILETTKSQETHFIENIGSELVENQNDKIVYLISDELSKFRDDGNIEKFIKDENKIPKLSFYLWSGSKFSYARYKSDLIILDTSKKVFSDFNTSNNLLNSDSIAAFLKRNYFNKDLDFGADESDTTAGFGDDENLDDENGKNPEPVTFDNITILENKGAKYFAGIIPIEKIGLRNTQFAEVIGYIVIALNSETINFYSENEFNTNIDFQSESISERLLSKPVITEIQNGEVVNSTNLEISRAILKYLPLFEESIKNSEKPASWRYDMIMNERYRTYYILSPELDSEDNISSVNNEKIFAVSIKRDDFGLLSFYFLKFVLFSLTVFAGIILLYSISYLFRLRNLKFNFREKLFISFVVVSVIPIVFLAIYTRTYINNKNDISYRNQLLSDLNILNETLKDEKILFNKYKPTDTIKQAGKDVLNKNFGNSDKNYNIFVKNKLVASTNEELYKSDFLDTRVDEEGYYNILILKKDVFLQNTNIRGQNYLVGYKPLKDRNGNVNGIISSLSVYRQKEIQEELTETLTFIFGSYFIVILILLLIVSLITAKISKPILVLQKATEKLARGEEDIVIDIERSDELGSLVDSFNKMTKDLAKSKENLKKAEREAAWRDIARRVAHEIKNPLTPMKLSIQHLYSLYQEKDFVNFEIVLKKTKELIINEIDKLNKIATAFSDFAKLPSRNYEPVNVNEILLDVISLYSPDKNVEFINELSPDIPYIRADKFELNRVFQNLIKNAVQSIEKDGKITVVSFTSGGRIVVEIIDNGCGMEEDILNKLFEPNFSTKSTGMGLGLAITRKSLDDMKASIKITSKLNSGTTVRIEFLKHYEK
ncbi:MAG: ATP-binding protein [Ignavibacteria bacterium]|nr:ATP-binding protein [Ignavibacteria bacterium]